MGEDVNERETPQREPGERRKPNRKQKRYLFLEDTHSLHNCICNITMFVSSEFDIFASKPVQESVHETDYVV